MTAEQQPPPIVLYDGECGLCSASVQYLLDHDRRGVLRFAALQGETGRSALAQHGCYLPGREAVASQKQAPDSLCVIVGAGLPTERLITESRAVLFIARCLGGWRGVFGALGSLIPRAIADGLYRAIARRRHRISRHAPACRLPNADSDSRFLP